MRGMEMHGAMGDERSEQCKTWQVQITAQHGSKPVLLCDLQGPQCMPLFSRELPEITVSAHAGIVDAYRVPVNKSQQR